MQRNQDNRTVARWTMLGAGLLAVTGLLTGCVSEKPINSSERSLIEPPALTQTVGQEDFAFPSRPPRLSLGKQVFEQNCATCHARGINYEKVRNSRPIDEFLLLTRGDNGHPAFRTKLTRDQRWEALFYTRFISGEGEIHNPDNVAAVFGGNCAVCHGTQGFADGPLYTGHASAHELGMAPVKNAFEPPPANFHSYSRMYNRTNAQIHKFIVEGVYPSAMPSWKGRKDPDKNFVFDDPSIEDLVRHVRSFSYENDLPKETAAAAPATQNNKETR